MPKISIVLPTYNGSRYIKDSINSIIEQTFTDWELIIINDCSTDETLSICKEFAQKDSRIKVFSNKENLKLPASLNVGFSKATGEYLTWTSDDNLYKQNALEIMARYLDENLNIDFVSADMDWVDEDLNFIEPHSNFVKRNSPITLSYHCNIGACFLYRKNLLKVVGEYDTSVFLAEDYDFWCRVALKANMAYLEENLYNYRSNQFSLSATKRKSCDEAGNKVRKKYADLIIKKYAKNFLEQISCKYQIFQKEKELPITLPIVLYSCYIKILRFLLNWSLHFHPKRKQLRARIIMNLTTV